MVYGAPANLPSGTTLSERILQCGVIEIPELPVHQDMATAGRGVLLVWHKHRERLKAKPHATERGFPPVWTV
jgi:hypothetical protein